MLFPRSPGRPQPWIPTAVVLGVVLGIVLAVAASRLPAVRAILADPGAPRFAGVATRAAGGGVVFLISMAMGRIPAAFALPAGIGDVLTGLAVPFALRSGRVTPSSEAVGTLPLVLIPWPRCRRPARCTW